MIVNFESFITDWFCSTSVAKTRDSSSVLTSISTNVTLVCPVAQVDIRKRKPITNRYLTLSKI